MVNYWKDTIVTSEGRTAYGLPVEPMKPTMDENMWDEMTKAIRDYRHPLPTDEAGCDSFEGLAYSVPNEDSYLVLKDHTNEQVDYLLNVFGLNGLGRFDLSKYCLCFNKEKAAWGIVWSYYVDSPNKVSFNNIFEHRGSKGDI